MNLRISNNVWNTIRFKLVAGSLIFLAPFILLFYYSNFYTINAARDQIAASNKNIVSLYLKQIENSLNDVGKYLADVAGNSTDIAIFESGRNDDVRMMAKVRLMNKMASDIQIYSSIDVIFIYSSIQNEFLTQKNGIFHEGEQFNFENFIKDILKNGKSADVLTEKWHAVKLDEQFYLFRLLKKNNTYFGAWAKADRLLVPLNQRNLSNKSISLFITSQGEPFTDIEFIRENNIDLKPGFESYYLTGDNNKYLVVGEEFSQGNFSMVVVTPENSMMSNLLYIQRVIILIAVSLILLLPVYLLLLRKTVLVPMDRIMSAMKIIRKGNLDVHIPPFKTSEEFRILNEMFNDMITQIQKLKIDIYEEKISRQKVELEHLQLQVKPHFYMNSLNIMNSLAKMKKYELLQEMSMCLIQYFRYMFKSNTAFVFLKDELRHVCNYIRIQELRFSKKLSSEIHAEEILGTTLVPPLIIHTFVENSIKYAVTMDEEVRISIRARIVENAREYGIKITVADSGKGFGEDILKKINSGERIIDAQGEHIGIRNIQKRLEILYAGRAYFSCKNNLNGGAVVEIFLPLDGKI